MVPAQKPGYCVGANQAISPANRGVRHSREGGSPAITLSKAVPRSGARPTSWKCAPGAVTSGETQVTVETATRWIWIPASAGMTTCGVRGW